MMYKLKSNLLIATLILVAFVSKAQTSNSMEKEKISQEQKRVLDAVEGMTSSFHKKDIEGVISSYEPNAIVVFEPETVVSDRRIIREMFQGAFALNPKFEYSGHEVFINDNIAVHFAPWTMTGKAPDGAEIKQSGLSVAVLRKQPDGRWLMIFDNPHGQYLMGNK